MSELSTFERIEALREKHGTRLAILGHHYQVDDVVRHVDLKGDSLELARRVPGLDAEYIVFCGVWFMAESAAILTKPGQKVFQPVPEAGCDMADMAAATAVEKVLEKLNAERKVIPLAYVNTSAAVKAVVGRFGGTVCTSANANTMLKWCVDRGDAVLFLPDKNLANNTADTLGIEVAKRRIIEIADDGAHLDMDACKAAELLIWPGYCYVHDLFEKEQMQKARAASPDAKIAVHPECTPPVVQEADFVGSTSSIIKYVADAPEGETIYIGTEISLVMRLCKEYAGKKDVRPLFESQCKDMAATTETDLLATLENLESLEPVEVAGDIAEPARLALERMLEACS